MREKNSGNSGKGNDRKGNQGGDTSKRGFASMDPEKQREIASEGGKASHGGGRGNKGGSSRNK